MSRRWSRSSCVNFFLALSVLSFPAVSAAAAKLPPLLVKVEAKYKTASTLMAEFSQVNESAVLKDSKTSTGVISIKKPGRIRWETQNPDPNIFITDGKSMWFYTPPFEPGENGQLVVRKASQYLSRLAGALLSGDFGMGKDLKVRAKAKTRNEFVLTPKPGTAGEIQEAEIAINLEKLLIEKVVLRHKGGNRTEISLGKIQLGPELDDGMFHFVPPPKTDIVKE